MYLLWKTYFDDKDKLSFQLEGSAVLSLMDCPILWTDYEKLRGSAVLFL